MRGDDLDVQEIAVKLELYAKETMASAEFLSQAFRPEFRVLFDKDFRAWRLMFRKHIPVVEMANDTWPADWWEAVKDRWFPDWLKRHYPVRRNNVKINLALNMAIPKHEGHRFIYIKNSQVLQPERAEDV